MQENNIFIIVLVFAYFFNEKSLLSRYETIYSQRFLSIIYSYMHNTGKKESEAGKTQFEMHKTLILIKPDTIARGIVGDILSRIEKKSLKIVAMKFIDMTEELCREHYAHIAHQPFFPKIVSYMTDGPVLALVIEGIDSVRQVRNLCGATDPQFAAPGTIRGDHSCTIDYNLIHSSDSIASADIEIARFFITEEVFQYTKNVYVN